MPIFEYRCDAGHLSERIRSFDARDTPVACTTCDQPAVRIFSHTHSPPSGVYSYSPNIGDAEVFEQRREAIKSGVKVMPKILSRRQRQRLQDEGVDV